MPVFEDGGDGGDSGQRGGEFGVSLPVEVDDRRGWWGNGLGFADGHGRRDAASDDGTNSEAGDVYEVGAGHTWDHKKGSFKVLVV